jgi:phosphoglycolate phosphatase-like HAD superfamily hydrolase
MMTDPQAPLREMKPEHRFFVGIDSDGCAFDTMEPKHKECFCPAFIWKFNLAAVSKYARDAWDFVNLYSKMRGCNRFLAVAYVLDFLRERDEVRARNAHIPEMKDMREWTKRETKLGNPALEEEVKRTGSKELAQLLDWSKTVNEMVAKIVKEVPPFPGVRESLVKLSNHADVMVVSATPGEALVREWQEHNIAKYVKVIAGQEMGTKAEHLKLGASGKYDADKILMVGDAEGDLKAARANNALFFPVNPGHEEDSWKLFLDEAMDKFLAGAYAGAYEKRLIDKFLTYLPEKPPWKK